MDLIEPNFEEETALPTIVAIYWDIYKQLADTWHQVMETRQDEVPEHLREQLQQYQNELLRIMETANARLWFLEQLVEREPIHAVPYAEEITHLRHMLAMTDPLYDFFYRYARDLEERSGRLPDKARPASGPFLQADDYLARERDLKFRERDYKIRPFENEQESLTLCRIIAAQICGPRGWIIEEKSVATGARKVLLGFPFLVFTALNDGRRVYCKVMITDAYNNWLIERYYLHHLPQLLKEKKQEGISLPDTTSMYEEEHGVLHDIFPFLVTEEIPGDPCGTAELAKKVLNNATDATKLFNLNEVVAKCTPLAHLEKEQAYVINQTTLGKWVEADSAKIEASGLDQKLPSPTLAKIELIFKAVLTLDLKNEPMVACLHDQHAGNIIKRPDGEIVVLDFERTVVAYPSFADARTLSAHWNLPIFYEVYKTKILEKFASDETEKLLLCFRMLLLLISIYHYHITHPEEHPAGTVPLDRLIDQIQEWADIAKTLKCVQQTSFSS